MPINRRGGKSCKTLTDKQGSIPVARTKTIRRGGKSCETLAVKQGSKKKSRRKSRDILKLSDVELADKQGSMDIGRSKKKSRRKSRDIDVDVSDLSDYHSEEIYSSDGGSGSELDDDIPFDSKWDICDLETTKGKKRIDPIYDHLQSYMREEHEWSGYGGNFHHVHVYGFYNNKKAEGGYGVLVRDKDDKPIVALYGHSRGKSYLYYLLYGMKRGLDCVDVLKLTKVYWAVNSRRVAQFYNFLFNCPSVLLSTVCHPTGVCRKCLRAQMGLGTEGYGQLFPVIEDIIDLQSRREFEKITCRIVRNASVYFLAECAAKKMKQDGTSNKVQEHVMMEPEDFPKKLNDLIEADKRILPFNLNKVQ